MLQASVFSQARTISVVVLIALTLGFASLIVSADQLLQAPRLPDSHNGDQMVTYLLNHHGSSGLTSHWDDFAASINWADYGTALEDTEAIARHLLANTPRAGSLGSYWDDFVFSINWADYIRVPPFLSAQCLEAC